MSLHISKIIFKICFSGTSVKTNVKKSIGRYDSNPITTLLEEKFACHYFYQHCYLFNTQIHTILTHFADKIQYNDNSCVEMQRAHNYFNAYIIHKNDLNKWTKIILKQKWNEQRYPVQYSTSVYSTQNAYVCLIWIFVLF